MPTNVDIPALGESVQEATLIKWHKNDGDAVAVAEPLAELETDKANVDVPSPAAGVLKRLKNDWRIVTGPGWTPWAICLALALWATVMPLFDRTRDQLPLGE